MAPMAPFGDVAPALELCRAAARGAPPDVVHDLALDTLRGLVRADGVLAAHVDGGPASVVARPGPVVADLLAGYADHVAGHPSDDPGGSEPVAHPVELVAGHLVCLGLPAPAGARVGMALHRSTPFTPAERTRVEAVAPVITCAVLAARAAPAPAREGLTAREAVVLRSVATGLSDKQAARLLGVSPRTVSKHLEHIYAKLGVAGRTEAAAQLWQGR